MRPRERIALDIVRASGSISRSELAAAMNCAPRTAGQYLWILKRQGLVQPSGFGRFARWSAVEQSNPAMVDTRMVSSVWGLAV